MAVKIRFAKAKKKPRKPKQSQGSLDMLAKLNSYLNQTEPETVQFLVNNLEGIQNAVTYKELREAYLTGGITIAQFEDWQKRYSALVKTVLLKKWMEAAEQTAKEEKDKHPEFVYDPSKSAAMEWLEAHAAELVTNLAREQMDALNAMVRHFSGYTAISPDEAARQMRACIGLTKPQALANLRYREAIKAEYLKQHPKAKVATAEKVAQEAAAKYAGRQHRYRAQSIARTELAFGYNAGAYGATKDAQKQGYIGECKKKWLTAYDERVCPICSAMDEEAVDMDSMFSNGKLLPPGHPMCRCAVAYIEVEKPAMRQTGQEIYSMGETAQEMANYGVSWNGAEAITHRKEAQQEIVDYANSKNIAVYAISRFDGDVNILKEQIDIISEAAREYNINEKITITFGEMGDEDFAETTNFTIRFNTVALRNREITNKNLNSDNFLASSDIRGIAIHEMGHIISRKYGEKGIEIARKAYYNLYNQDISNNDLVIYIKESISEYAVFIDLLKINKPFKMAYYKEITPEILAKDKTDSNEFTREFARILKEVIK